MLVYKTEPVYNLFLAERDGGCIYCRLKKTKILYCAKINLQAQFIELFFRKKSK